MDQYNESLLASKQHYLKLNVNKQTFILFHYPIHEWDGMHRGDIHLFGHVHGNHVGRGKSMDVGIDTRPNGDLGLYHIDEICDIMKTREVLSHGSGRKIL